MRKFCVIGTPVGHSKSPELFERFSGELGVRYGIDVFYTKKEITGGEELKNFIEELRNGIYRGCNVTMPWKTEIVKYMDELSETAEITGSVNTVALRNGRLYGDSTDGRGMMNAIEEAAKDCAFSDCDSLKKKNDAENFPGRRSDMVILGCGGAARSIIAEALIRKTGKIAVVCRGVKNRMDPGSVKNISSNIDLTMRMLKNSEVTFIDFSDTDAVREAIQKAGILINSTPVGMIDGKGNEKNLPIDENIELKSEMIVADCVYNPDETLLIKKAASSGCKVVKGIRMLEEQARCGVRVLLGI